METNITESRLQSDCFQWHWNTFPTQRMRLIMIYNNPKNAAHGAILKAMGMVKGASDLLYTHPNGELWYLECKLENGIQSPAQKKFQQRVESYGHKYFIFRSLDEFKALLSG